MMLSRTKMFTTVGQAPPLAAHSYGFSRFSHFLGRMIALEY
jgi:hypothetical protein